MCGIVGLISKKPNGFGYEEQDLFTNMLIMDTIRGSDSTGAFGVDQNGKVDIIKGNTNGWQFTQCQNYIDFKHRIYSTYKTVIGHNRAATKGTVSAANAHPFKEEGITLVHNGTIFNADELAKDTEVDSHAITKALAGADAAKALNQVHGPFALVWFDSKQGTLNLARNKDRPLFLLEYTNFWTVSSEPGLAYWLNGRDGRPLINKPILVPTEKILRFNISNLESGYSEMDFENYSLPVYNKPSWSPVVNQHLRVVQNPKPSSLSAGDEVVFNVDDVKFEDGDKFYTVFGHPIFTGGEMDTNILVKTSIATKQELDAVQAAGYATGTITSVSSAGTMPILFVRWCTPMKLHKDKNENTTTEEDINAAIKTGCTRCKGMMAFTDIASSIVRKKKDGTYRTLCKDCLNKSLSEIPEKGKILAQ